MNLKRLEPWWRAISSAAVPVDSEARPEIIQGLLQGAWLTRDYIALILSSCAIATFGLLENSAAVIIGAMIIAPLMTVIQAIAYSALEGNARTFRRAVSTLAVGIVAAVLFSTLLARSVGLSDFGTEILSRVRPNLLDLGIALAAGTIGAFARNRPSISSTLAGTAIAVALMPPLCVVGIGIAGGDWQISRGAALLFTTNLLGITLASMIVFLLAGLANQRAAAALAWTGALVAVIIVPLALSFQTLVRETTLESSLRGALRHQTVTFRHADLVSTEFDWLARPPVVSLYVRSNTILSSHQVALLEAFAQRITREQIRLVVNVAQTERVTSKGYQTPSEVPH